jgi:DNA polymerase-3 subunit beta
MKINPSFLIKMLSPMQVVIQKNHRVLPICECVKLDSTGFTGTNLEQTVHIPYKNLPEICIDFREFIDTLKTLGNRIVEMQVDSVPFGKPEKSKTGEMVQNYRDEITFTTGDMTMKIVGESIKTFPKIAEFKPGIKTTLPILTDFTPFASKDEHKPAMNGIFVGKDICSTDAHRMKFEPNPYHKEGNPGIVLPLIVAQKFCNEIRTIEINDKQEIARIHLEYGYLQTRLIDDKFPEYQNVIPELTETIAKVSKQAIISGLQACLKYTNQTTFQVRLSLTSDKMTISAEDIDWAKEFSTNIPCEWNGEPGMEFGFNAKFLIECLKDCKGNVIELNLTTPNRCGRINSNMLIMPVMLSSYAE